jgi:hypothetical protein
MAINKRRSSHIILEEGGGRRRRKRREISVSIIGEDRADSHDHTIKDQV